MEKQAKAENLKMAAIHYMNNDIAMSIAAKMFNVSLSALHKHLKLEGLRKIRGREKIKVEGLEDAMNLYLNSDLSAEEVGKVFGVSKTVITRYANETNRGPARQEKLKKKIKKQEYENIKNLYASGLSAAKIAKKYQVAESSIGRILKLNGTKLTIKNCFSFLTEEQKRDIINMYSNKSFFIADIIDKYNLNKSALRNWIIQQGIEPRSTGEIQCLESSRLTSRGINGKYKGYSFRSLKELCFIGQILMKKYKNDEWRSGENKLDRIKYIDQAGKSRWYYPDFIIKDKIIVECRPKDLQHDDLTRMKCIAARKFCIENNKKFKMIDPKKDKDFILQEYLAGNIEMHPSVLKRFKRIYKNQLTKPENLLYIH